VLGGLLTTVLLAWWCVGWGPRDGVIDGPKNAMWPSVAPADWPPPQRPQIDLGWGVRETWYFQLQEGDRRGRPATHYLLNQYEGGWPWPALRAEAWFQTSDPRRLETPGDLVRHNGLAMVGDEHNGGRCLPIRPLWPGFALDAACFTAGLLLMVGLVRYRRRREATDGIDTNRQS
jgi:hypothetical protein